MLKYLSIRNVHRNYAPKLSNQEYIKKLQCKEIIELNLT